MAKVLVNRAKMTTATTGTGTITLGSTVSGFQSFSDAGVVDGNIVRYVIEDGDYWELGLGTYTASGTTLARNVVESSNSNQALNLSGSAFIFVTAGASDYVQSDGDVMTGDLTVTNIITSGNVDGRDVSVDGAKLDGIEANATADQTKSDIDALNINADTLDGQHGSYYTGYVDTAIANLADSAPETLNTLNELASALGDDANFSTTITNSIATKLPLAGGTLTGNLTVPNIITSGNVDGRDLSADGSKLDGIEVGATADQTAAQIKASYESNSNTNEFSDAEQTKLANIESNATADQTSSEIRSLVNSASDSNVFTDADHTKLDAIEANATADQTGAEIKALYEAEVNAFTDTLKSKLDSIEASATADQTASEIRTLVESATDSNVFTDADHTKLNSIEASADVTDTTNVVASLTAGTNIAIASDGTISSTDTNTTYSVQDGQLSQNNFTNADHSKLDGIEANADVTDTSNVVASLTAGTNVAIAANGTISSTNTTYTVQDGELSQNNFTDADHSKLNAIEANADVTDTTNVVSALTAGTNVSIASNGTISSTDTNTTYSIQDGELSQNNFTDADHTKLNGIEASATADQTKADIEGLGIDVPATNLTGTIPAARLSTATTQAESDDSTKIATTAYVVDKITTLIGGAPSTLNDLNELAAAINDDANYNTTLTTALATKLPLAGGAITGNVTFGDNNKAIFGSGSDLWIYSDGTDSYIEERNGTGSLYIDATDLQLRSTANAKYFRGITGGAVDLYHNNASKLSTTSTGVSITGSLAVSDASTTRTNLDVDQAGSALAFAIALG